MGWPDEEMREHSRLSGSTDEDAGAERQSSKKLRVTIRGSPGQGQSFAIWFAVSRKLELLCRILSHEYML